MAQVAGVVNQLRDKKTPVQSEHLGRTMVRQKIHWRRLIKADWCRLCVVFVISLVPHTCGCKQLAVKEFGAADISIMHY